MQWEEITFELIFFHVIFYCEVTHKKVQRMKNDNIFSTSKPYLYLCIYIVYKKKLLSTCLRMSKGEKRKYKKFKVIPTSNCWTPIAKSLTLIVLGLDHNTDRRRTCTPYTHTHTSRPESKHLKLYTVYIRFPKAYITRKIHFTNWY
jgi:hypothetical protein